MRGLLLGKDLTRHFDDKYEMMYTGCCSKRCTLWDGTRETENGPPQVGHAHRHMGRTVTWKQSHVLKVWRECTY